MNYNGVYNWLIKQKSSNYAIATVLGVMSLFTGFVGLMGLISVITGEYFEFFIEIIPLSVTLIPAILTLNKGAMASRCLKYVPIMQNGKKEISLDVFARAANRDKITAAKDLRWMMTSDYLPGAYINESTQMVHLPDAKVQQQPVQEQQSYISPLQAEGTAYLKAMEQMKDNIEDEDVSQKTVELRQMVGKLLAYGYHHPQDAPEIQKFNRKYLNSVLKLMRNFDEIETQLKESKIYGDAKAELMKTMNMLIDAYKLQLEGLYQDDMLDISTDVTVLENMLSQEGLLKNDLVMDFDSLQENK